MPIFNGLPGDDSLTGGDTDDELYGFDGNDTLLGAGGSDLLDGGNGDDYAEGNEGADSLRGGLGADELRGDAGNDSIAGEAGNDYLFGGAGDDLIDGGEQTDLVTFLYATSGVTVDLATGSATGEGNDTLVEIENVSGSDFADTLSGDAGRNNLLGRAGDDRLSGVGGSDTLEGGAGDDTLDGGEGLDFAKFESAFASYHISQSDGTIVVGYIGQDTGPGAGVGTDTLLGIETLVFRDLILAPSAIGTAADDVAELTGPGGGIAIGGGGNDTFVVDDPLDRPVEYGGEGVDTVQASVSWTLGKNLENLVLTGTGNLQGTGNAARNTITGTSGTNRLLGGGGNDTLNGGAGADTLRGGAGADTYYVDTRLDVVYEAPTSKGGTGVHALGTAIDPQPDGAGSNIDTVIAQVSYTLRANVENLKLAGNGSLNGNGNGLDNILTGNTGANRLGGLGGVDILNGGGGNDTLAGGAGNDRLAGEAGADSFVFDTPLSATTNKDTIADFTRGSDRLVLDIDVFPGLAGTGALATAAFHAAAGAKTAHDADDRIVYDTSTGVLYYDADGAGGTAALPFAALTKLPAITAADFTIVS